MAKTEVLIVKNPAFYRSLAPEAFQVLIQDGTWIPLVFNAVQRVVEARYFDLCELDWDYIREIDDEKKKTYVNYKSIYSVGLNEKQGAFVRQVADEIEQEITLAAEEALRAKEENEE